MPSKIPFFVWSDLFGSKARASLEKEKSVVKSSIDLALKTAEELNSYILVAQELREENSKMKERLEELDSPSEPGSGKYTFRMRHDVLGFDCNVSFNEISKKAAREKIKKILHASWRIINFTKEGVLES